MGLLINLGKNRDYFLGEVKMILDFIEEVGEFLSQKGRKSNVKLVDVWDQQKGELKKELRRIPSVINMFPYKYREFLSEMTLSYLISYQEAFIKECLRIILISRKSILKSKKKQLTYEEMCKFQSIKSLISHIAQKEVNELGRGSVDDISKYFDNQFDLSFEKFSNWQILREAAYRRNLIVHNKGITNDVYCFKTGYKKENERLKTDIDYVKNICIILLKFIDFLHDGIIEKLKLIPTIPNA